MDNANTIDNSPIREIRKEFFAFRNGIIADKLRKAGDPHTMIMGCLLVDISSIAARIKDKIDDTGQLALIAQQLWDDINSRECRLAAPMLYPAPLMTGDAALQWCESVESAEVADNLCHKLLRYIQDGDNLCNTLIASDKPLVKYTGYRLMLNLLILGKIKASDSLRALVENEASQAKKPLLPLLNDILEELD